MHVTPPASPLGARLGLREALKSIVGNRLPGDRVGDVCPPARAHPRIAVERPHADAHLGRIVRIAAEQMRAALAAEALLEPAIGMPPRLHQIASPQQAKCAAIDSCLRRRRGAGAPLAAGAVAVAGGRGGLAQLEADTAAQTAAGERGAWHRLQCASSRVAASAREAGPWTWSLALCCLDVSLPGRAALGRCA